MMTALIGECQDIRRDVVGQSLVNIRQPYGGPLRLSEAPRHYMTDSQNTPVIIGTLFIAHAPGWRHTQSHTSRVRSSRHTPDDTSYCLRAIGLITATVVGQSYNATVVHESLRLSLSAHNSVVTLVTSVRRQAREYGVVIRVGLERHILLSL